MMLSGTKRFGSNYHDHREALDPELTEHNQRTRKIDSGLASWLASTILPSPPKPLGSNIG
jgi:hypothetical protein